MPSSSDPEIICFQHCSGDSSIFCLEVPETCPLCSLEILSNGSSNSQEPKDSFLATPLMIPCPFVSGSQTTCSLLIRPSVGDFLHTYCSSSDLHVGVTDSLGNIYEFDEEGVRKTSSESGDSSLWEQSLVIPIFKTDKKDDGLSKEKWVQHWDYTLSITSCMDVWSRKEYKESDNNCYSFVLFFLKMLKWQQFQMQSTHESNIQNSLSSKTLFCQEYILPRTRLAAKYIALYRKVIREGVSVIPVKQRLVLMNNPPEIAQEDTRTTKLPEVASLSLQEV